MKSQMQRGCRCHQRYRNKQTLNEEEAVEFLKLMKHNKYSVIEQLKKPYKDTPDASYPEF
jgi:hypothetical protein